MQNRFAHVSRSDQDLTLKKGADMGKYFLAWILGVPAFALVLIYLVVH